jgi:hypothetical protein
MSYPMKSAHTDSILGGIVSIVFLLSLVHVALVPPLMAARGSQAEWSNLKQLHPEEKIEVVDMKLAKVKGLFQGFSEDTFTLNVEQKAVVLQRSEVYRVTSLEHPKRARNALIGLGVGAGLVGIIAAAAGDSVETTGTIAVFWSALIGGPVIGAVMPSYQTVYRAAQGPKQPSK